MLGSYLPKPRCILESPQNSQRPPLTHMPLAPPTPVSEEQCLYQIYIDELYGGLQRPSEEEKKK